MEPLWTWLSTPAAKDDVLDLFGVVCLLLFAPGYLLSAYLAGPGADRLSKDPVQLAGIREWASIGLWVFGAGLFFFGARALQINPLWIGAPIWLVGSIVAVIFAAVRCLDWWRTVYPEERARRSIPDGIYPLPDLETRRGNSSARKTLPKTTVRT
jgi:hypothetical protein